MGAPLGIAAGTWLSEYAGARRIGMVVRFVNDILLSAPSIVLGLFGVPQWKVIVQVLYRGASAGIVTGILLALARISGETAPLLFTSFGNQYWSTDLASPMASVPVVMNQFTASPYESWHTLAWAGALVLTFFVLVLSLLARAILSRNKVRHD
jgi:phosphate transport system permease protein